MKRFVLLFCVMFALTVSMAVPAMSQQEVPAVLAPDDSLPILGSVMLDPSNHPVTFPANSFFDIFTELSLDVSGASRAPAAGVAHTVVWDGSADLRVSNPNGTAGMYRENELEMVVHIDPRSPVGDLQIFDTEVLSLSISGGSLPVGVMIRESPTLASTGKTSIRSISGGGILIPQVEVTSFFDIFVELSVDGGATWLPGDGPVRIEAKIKPTILINRPDPPPIMAGKYIGDLDRDGRPDLVVGIVDPPTPPAADVTKVSAITARFGKCIGTDSGDSKYRLASPGHVTVSVTHTFDDGDTQFFDTEMLEMDISGGALPVGTMIRESPSLPSKGKTSIRQLPSGQSYISSFFDVFTELSIDGGQTWTPQPPVSLELTEPLIQDVPPVELPETKFPPPNALMLDPSNQPVTFGSSGTLSEVELGLNSTTPFKLPLPGAFVIQTIHGTGKFQIVVSGSATEYTCPMDATMRVTSSSSSDEMRTFDTEMLSLSLSGGTLPSGVMIRESPSRPSLGRMKAKEKGNRTKCGSFFDVFLELSIDGGQTWTPADSDGIMQLEIKVPRAPINVNTYSVLPPGSLAVGGVVHGDPDFDLLRITHNTVPPPPIPPVGSSSTVTLGGVSSTVVVDGRGLTPEDQTVHDNSGTY